MIGENFGIKLFYSKTGGHVLTPFFGTCLADAGAKGAADRSKDGWATFAADGVELMLDDCTSEVSCGVQVLCKSFCYRKIVFFLVNSYHVVID
jgi:hypothetical protein